jgi:hypothetical protein
VFHSDPAAEPFLSLPEKHRPPGFVDWRKFGAPPEAPGQASHHPAVKEHEMIAWLLTMHFLSALELVAAYASDGSLLHCKERTSVLPHPLASEAESNSKPWTSVLFGDSNRDWQMNPIHCRTTFEPIQDGKLSEIVVAGSVGEDVDVLLPKSNMFYNRGWVLDMSENEKKAKHKLDRFGGLGFRDSKKAYYGLYSSGSLVLLIPYAGTSEMPQAGDRARDWFESVAVCEVNESREPGTCNTETDVEYSVGGANSTNATMIDAAGTLYLGKKLCSFLAVPENARLTTRKSLLRKRQRQQVEYSNKEEAEQVGLGVKIRVHNNRLMRPPQACSVSHVIWEQRRRPEVSKLAR